MPAIDLTAPQRRALHDVFRRYADRVETVAVYGSRARGAASPGSDVDIVLYGQLTPGDIAAITNDLEESALSVFADVVAYGHVTHAGLKAEIDRIALPLFQRDDLRAAAA